MYRLTSPETEYPGQSTRRKPAFEPINPFAPRRQRTLSPDGVKDVDEIGLPPQRSYQAGQSPCAMPAYASHSPYNPIMPWSAPAPVHYTSPYEYRAPQSSHETPNRPPSTQSGEIPSRPPSTQSEVRSRASSTQLGAPGPSSKDVDEIGLPPQRPHQAGNSPFIKPEPLFNSPDRPIIPTFSKGHVHFDSPYGYQTPQSLHGTPSRPPSSQLEVPGPSSPILRPIPTQYSGLQPSPEDRIPPLAAPNSPPIIPPPKLVQYLYSQLNTLPMSPQTLSNNGPPNQIAADSSLHLSSSFHEVSDKNASSTTYSTANSSPVSGFNYHEPINLLGVSPAQPSVGAAFNSSGPSRRFDRFFFIDLLRDIYYLLLLNVPRLYYSRVGRVLKEAQLSIEEMMEMSLVSSPAYKRFQEEIMETGFFNPNVRYSTPAYERLRAAWELFIDGLLQDWKALNVMTVLLLSAIVSIFQIDSAAEDPVTRYTAFWSLICALMSLMYSCVFLTQFASMRQPYKAVEWAVEAQKKQLSLWNVWIMLATPVVWLSWSLIAFIVSIMSFMWRVGIKSSGRETSVAPEIELIFRALLTFLFLVGIICGILIINTLRRYGSRMDEAWERRIDGFISRTLPGDSQEKGSPPPVTHPATRPPGSPYFTPFTSPPFSSYTSPRMYSGLPWTSVPPFVPPSSYTIPHQHFVVPRQSSDALGDPNPPYEANADMAADGFGGGWDSSPHPHPQTFASENINPSLPIWKYRRSGFGHYPEPWGKQLFDKREETDTPKLATISPHATSELTFSPAREGVEVAMAIQSPVDNLTTRLTPRSPDESHHPTFISGKERGRSRSPVIIDHTSPPVSENDTPRTTSYCIRRESLTSYASGTQEERREVGQMPTELSPTSIPDLPPGASHHIPSPSSPISGSSRENPLGSSTPTAIVWSSRDAPSLSPTSLSLEETQ